MTILKQLQLRQVLKAELKASTAKGFDMAIGQAWRAAVRVDCSSSPPLQATDFRKLMHVTVNPNRWRGARWCAARVQCNPPAAPVALTAFLLNGSSSSCPTPFSVTAFGFKITPVVQIQRHSALWNMRPPDRNHRNIGTGQWQHGARVAAAAIVCWLWRWLLSGP
jgi:hypothetical protein